MPAEHESTDAGGLSRRQLVTRGAIAGGLVWAAPIIRTTAAYATTANGTERPCQNFYMVVINPAGNVMPAPAHIDDHTTPPKIRQWFTDNPGVTVQYPSVAPQLTAVSDEEAAVLLPAVTGPNASGRQCRMVIGWARKGGNSFSEAFVDPSPPIAVAVGRRLIFPCPRAAAATVGASSVDSSSTSTSTTTTTTAPPTAAFSAASNGNGQGQNGNSQGNGNGQGNQGNQGNQGDQGNQGNGNSGDHGNGFCFDDLYLIYCCPR
jgi:hypothetical protein